MMPKSVSGFRTTSGGSKEDMFAENEAEIETAGGDHAAHRKGTEILGMFTDDRNLRRNPVDHLFDGGIHRLHRKEPEKQQNCDDHLTGGRADQRQRCDRNDEEAEFLAKGSFLQHAQKARPGIAGGGDEMPKSGLFRHRRLHHHALSSSHCATDPGKASPSPLWPIGK
ncbi:hypothetical protein RHECNPAF_64200104 [Rhizobium etli CNPAF512]|nr:hypothetical protein RHECNPAF_64200104 [Rhizobium etli CNPAF512]